jgi:hypothetical protein
MFGLLGTVYIPIDELCVGFAWLSIDFVTQIEYIYNIYIIYIYIIYIYNIYIYRMFFILMFIWYHLVRVLVKPQVVLGFIPGEVWMSLWHHIGGRMMDLRRAELMQKTDFSGRPGWKTARMG